MELIYPFILILGIPFLIFLIVKNFKKKDAQYNNGRKVANTQYIKNSAYYKKIIGKYKILFYFVQGVCLVSILFSMILIARPAKKDTKDSKEYKRDIFLCMDVSMSVNEVNEKLVDSFKKVVKGLQGERFGITIFNTTSVLLVPLTDDYEYVLDILDQLEESFRANIDNDYSDFYTLNYILEGTVEGSEERGSSLIGDGLASCVYNFPALDEDRSRVIIFSTDNDLAGDELISLKDAAKLAKKNIITVYGIAPDDIWSDNEEEFEEAMEIAGGELYKASSPSKVFKIINNIEEKEKSLIEMPKEIKKIDVPQIPFIILLVSVVALFVLIRKVDL